MNIEFSCKESLWGVAEKPYRAQKALPDWWKKLERRLNQPGFPAQTIKACIPVSDMLTSGYIIPLPFDLHIKSEVGGVPEFSWNFAPGQYVEFHSIEQVPIYGGAWKLINPWKITTPPGFSTMFLHPVHRPDLPFKTLEAVVDTDLYDNMVNFPFLWPDIDYDGVLRAGTPFVQVIPFQRQQWTMTIKSRTEKEQRRTEVTQDKLMANQHGYRRFWHKPKVYLEEK